MYIGDVQLTSVEHEQLLVSLLSVAAQKMTCAFFFFFFFFARRAVQLSCSFSAISFLFHGVPGAPPAAVAGCAARVRRAVVLGPLRDRWPLLHGQCVELRGAVVRHGLRLFRGRLAVCVQYNVLRGQGVRLLLQVQIIRHGDVRRLRGALAGPGDADSGAAAGRVAVLAAGLSAAVVHVVR